MSYRNTQHIEAGRRESGRQRRGQATIMVALGLTVMMGVLGLVVDLGWNHFLVQSQQAAADSGVMAATIQAKVNNKNVSNFCSSLALGGCTTAWTTCPVAATDSLYSACQYVKTNIFDPRATVQVMEGINAAPPTGGSLQTAYWAQVLIKQNVNQLFSWVVGNKVGLAFATATALVVKTAVASPACVNITDPTGTDFWGAGDGTLFATGNTPGPYNLLAGCGISVANYGGSSISVNGLATIKGGNITTCGGEATNTGSITAGSGDTNTFGTGGKDCAKGFSDPNKGLALPSINGVTASAAANSGPACGTSYTSAPYGQSSQTTINSNSNYLTGANGCNSSGPNYCASAAHPLVLNPGVYCGGLTIQGAGVVFNPGVYIMNGGQFVIQNSSTVTNGTSTASGAIGGVTFYLTGYNTGSGYNGQGAYKGFLMGDSNVVEVDLTAPTTGTYDGILIYQDPGIEPLGSTGPSDPSTSTINADGSFTLAGQIYLPTTALILSGQPTASQVTGIDVYALELNGSTSLTMAAGGGGGGGGATAWGPATMTN
jgi:Flp pilus assembly protein TadG